MTSRLRHGGALALAYGVLLLALAGCGSVEDPGAAGPAATTVTTGQERGGRSPERSVTSGRDNG